MFRVLSASQLQLEGQISLSWFPYCIFRHSNEGVFYGIPNFLEIVFDQVCAQEVQGSGRMRSDFISQPRLLCSNNKEGLVGKYSQTMKFVILTGLLTGLLIHAQTFVKRTVD